MKVSLVLFKNIFINSNNSDDNKKSLFTDSNYQARPCKSNLQVEKRRNTITGRYVQFSSPKLCGRRQGGCVCVCFNRRVSHGTRWSYQTNTHGRVCLYAFVCFSRLLVVEQDNPPRNNTHNCTAMCVCVYVRMHTHMLAQQHQLVNQSWNKTIQPGIPHIRL